MRKAFTLMEITTALIVVLILATLGLATYRQAVDNARQKVCATNLIILGKAVENHILGTAVAPSALKDIDLEYLRAAYVEVMKDAGFLERFSYFFVKLNTPKQAYAAIEELKDLVDYQKMREYGIPLQVFQCPADHDPPPEGISYGINANMAGKRWKEILADPGAGVIIGDCENKNGTFTSPDTELEPRHMEMFGFKNVSQAVTPRGKLMKIPCIRRNTR